MVKRKENLVKRCGKQNLHRNYKSTQKSEKEEVCAAHSRRLYKHGLDVTIYEALNHS